MIEKWRLIISPPNNGALNMAIDEALLLSSVKKGAIPALRLYAWDPGCLSLGFAQPFTDIDEIRLAEFGWDFIRRPTGGRAILHIDELTYSVTATQEDPLVRGGVLESYRRLSEGLLSALNFLGVQANADKEYNNHSLQKNNPVCFEVPSNYEITAAGKKLIGSAQSRKSGGVLQHGSLPLFGDIARINDVLKYSNEDERKNNRERIYSHATTLEEVLKTHISWEKASEALVTGFEKALNIVFSGSKLADEEIELVDQLLTDKYSTHEWNCK